MDTPQDLGPEESASTSVPEPELSNPGIFIDVDGIDRAELVLPYGYLAKIRNYLFSDTSKEYICHLLCGHTLIGGRLRLLACYFAHPEPEDYIEQTLASIRLDPAYDLALRKECRKQRLSLVDIHSHPFSSHAVAFSGVDDHDESLKAKYFDRNLPDSVFASVVMGRNSQQARLFLRGSQGRRTRSVAMSIYSRDLPIGSNTETGDNVGGAFRGGRFDRQIRAFSAEGQARLQTTKVGIVGVGGLGAGLAIGLARLGVRHFTLIDPDRAEPTNLNRLAGMTAVDASLRPLKIDLVARRITEIDGDATIDRCPWDIFQPSAWQRLRDQDLIIAATDNHSTRLLLNSISHQYLVPLVSIGTLIRTRDGEFENGFGEVCTVLPGQPEPCLLCSQAIDKAEAYYELGPDANRREAFRRGYIEDYDAPAPAVHHLNGVVTNLALVEIHNLICGFMPPRPHLHYSMVERRVLSIEDESVHCGVCSPDGLNFARGDQIDPVVNLFGRDKIGAEFSDAPGR
jgi:molybdopterin/thiamine biosynthesis adenylyltransferase